MVANSPPLTNTLADLAERIASLHREYQSHRDDAAACIVTFGRMLNEAKAEECRHGEWLPFLERTGIPPRTAQRAMRIAAAEVKYATVAHLGAAEVDRLIGIAKRRGVAVTDEALLTLAAEDDDSPPLTRWEKLAAVLERGRAFAAKPPPPRVTVSRAADARERELAEQAEILADELEEHRALIGDLCDDLSAREGGGKGGGFRDL